MFPYVAASLFSVSLFIIFIIACIGTYVGLACRTAVIVSPITDSIGDGELTVIAVMLWPMTIFALLSYYVTSPKLYKSVGCFVSYIVFGHPPLGGNKT